MPPILAQLPYLSSIMNWPMPMWDPDRTDTYLGPLVRPICEGTATTSFLKSKLDMLCIMYALFAAGIIIYGSYTEVNYWSIGAPSQSADTTWSREVSLPLEHPRDRASLPKAASIEAARMQVLCRRNAQWTAELGAFDSSRADRHVLVIFL